MTQTIVSASDRYNHQVYKYTMDGKEVMTLGKKHVAGDNSSTDLFNGTADVGIDRNGDIFVAEWQVLEQWKLPTGWPTGITIGPDDTVYIADIDANTIMVWKDGKMLDIIGSLQAGPHNIAIDPATGVLYLAKRGNPV